MTAFEKNVETDRVVIRVIKNFYSDLHDAVFNLIHKTKYITNSIISQRLMISSDRVKAITFSLYNEDFIRFQDRLFKKTITDEKLISQGSKKKVYRVRYWFTELNFTYKALQKRLKKKFNSECSKKKNSEIRLFKCQRKYCGEVFDIKDLGDLKYDFQIKAFLCSKLIGPKIVCGSKLIEVPSDSLEDKDKDSRDSIDFLSKIILSTQ